jgi:glycosyltransferase involved in cell wall biosynthesis
MRLLMLGPALDVRGGVSAVERLVLERLPRESATHIPTMVDGSKAAKLAVFARALALAWRRTTGRPLVHIHFASRASTVRKMALARLALARGCKVILHAHGGGYRAYWESLPPRRRARYLEVFRRCHALIVLGQGWRAFFAGIGVPAGRIVVLPNPVALPASLPPREEGERVLFVYLGLIAERKGAFDLVEALGRLAPASRGRLRVVVAGNGEHAALRRRIDALALQGVVEMRTWLQPAERDALLAEAHGFVLPSHHEGLPMALLEAMAWRLAPVCTPVGSIPEVLRHEANGLLVPPRDPAALAAALERLAADAPLRARLGLAARASVEGLSVDTYVEKLLALYEDVACRD